MKFYKDTNDLWVLGELIIPQGSCVLYVRDDSEVVEIRFLNGDRVFNEAISELRDETDTPYTDLADLLLRCGDFFVKATGGGLSLVATDGTIDGDGTELAPLSIAATIGDINAILDEINGEVI